MMRFLLGILFLILCYNPAVSAPGDVGTMQPNAKNAILPAARDNLHSMPVIDARDPAYGMKCDNSTDDAAALQAALTAAATKGSAVFISGNSSGAQATCLLSTQVNPSNGTTLWAVPGTVILKAKTGNVSNPLLFGATNVSNVYVYGITFDGGGQDFGSANNVTGIYGGVTPADNVVFDQVRFQHTRGISFIGSTAVTNSGVKNSYFTDIGNHWKTTALAADRIQAMGFCCGTTATNHGNFSINNYFTDIGLDSISTSQQHDFTATGNTCYGLTTQLTITWTNPQPTGYGGCVYGAANDAMTITNNRCDGIPGNCIDTLNVGDRVISNNIAYNSGDTGIGVFGTGNATIIGNISKNGGQWASAAAANGASGIEFNGTLGKISMSSNVSTDDQAAISTTCTGTVGVGATTCTVASVTGMMVNDQIKIAGAAVASADLSTAITGIAGSVITWRTATSTSTSGAAVTGIATQFYGAFAQAGTTFTELQIAADNSLSGNIKGPIGGPIFIQIPNPNYLLNGGFDLDQANESASVTLTTTGTPYIVPDGWNAFKRTTTATGVTAQRVTDAPAGAVYSLKYTVGTGGSNEANTQAAIYQAISSADILGLNFGTNNAKPLYISLDVKCSASRTLGISLQNGIAYPPDRSFVHTIAATTSWARYSFYVPGDVTGTWTGTDPYGIFLNISFAGGTDFQTATPDIWVAGNFLTTSAQTQMTLTSGAWCEVAKVKVEQSTIATPFVHEEFSALLTRAQLRYRKTFPFGVKPAQNAGLGGSICIKNPIALGDPSSMWQWAVPMVQTPTITTYNPSATNSKWRNVTAAADVTESVDPGSSLGVSTGVLLATSGTVATLGDILCIHAVADGSLQ